MVYIILTVLYSYLILRALMLLSTRGKLLLQKSGSGLRLIELVIMVVSISYLFNYYYFQQSEFKNFIVSAEILWIAFIVCVILFGVGAGARFILSFVDNFIPNETEVIFKKTKQVYEVFAQIWLNVSLVSIFFIFSLMEISKPIENLTDIKRMIAVYSLSAVLGIIFAIFHKQDHIFIQRVTLVAMILVSICLGLFIYETEAQFLTTLPVSTSFIFFNAFFLLVSQLPIFKVFNRLKSRVQGKSTDSNAESFDMSQEPLLPFQVDMPTNYEPVSFPQSSNSNIQINLHRNPNSFNFIKDDPRAAKLEQPQEVEESQNFYYEKGFSEIPQTDFSDESNSPDFLSLKHLGKDA